MDDEHLLCIMIRARQAMALRATRNRRLIKQGKMFSIKPPCKVGFKRIGHLENGEMTWQYRFERKKWVSKDEYLCWNERRERWEAHKKTKLVSDIYNDVRENAGNLADWATRNFKVGGAQNKDGLYPYHKIGLETI